MIDPQSPKSSNRKTACSSKQTVSNSQSPNFDSVITALTPVNRATCRDGSTLWSLVVKKCSFCGKSHQHGGGTGERPLLGTRESHCLRKWREYRLVAVGGGAL